jgi:hypothetical protein
MRRIHLSDLMLMAGVLNSEVENLSGILPGAPLGSKTGCNSRQSSEITPLETIGCTADP